MPRPWKAAILTTFGIGFILGCSSTPESQPAQQVLQSHARQESVSAMPSSQKEQKEGLLHCRSPLQYYQPSGHNLILYFIPSNSPAGPNGRNLKAGRCAYEEKGVEGESDIPVHFRPPQPDYSPVGSGQLGAQLANQDKTNKANHMMTSAIAGLTAAAVHDNRIISFYATRTESGFEATNLTFSVRPLTDQTQ